MAYVMTKERADKLIYRAEMYAKLYEKALNLASREPEKYFEKVIKFSADSEAALYLAQLALRELNSR